jgi:hypothetical protein
MFPAQQGLAVSSAVKQDEDLNKRLTERSSCDFKTHIKLNCMTYIHCASRSNNMATFVTL